MTERWKKVALALEGLGYYAVFLSCMKLRSIQRDVSFQKLFNDRENVK